MVTRSIQFGSVETKLLFHLEEKDAIIVTSQNIAKILGVSVGHANKVAWQLAKKKRLLRFRKGVYLFAPMKAGPKGLWTEHKFIIVDELLKKKPYYISFWNALNHYGLTEQIPITVQVIVTQRRRNFHFLGAKFEFITVKQLGEWKEEKIANHSIKMATIEQLLIDCLTHPRYAGGMEEISKSIWNAKDEINWNKLKELAFQSTDAVQRRLGYLAEFWKLPLKLSIKPTGWRWLDPSSTKIELGRSEKWGLLLNIEERKLKQWMES